MDGSTIIFYLLAAMILVCGILAVTSRMIFRAAIFLLFTLVGIAGLYFWMDFQFIAAVQVVVYVGGIVVLIIFSIFLTQQAGNKLRKPTLWRSIFSAMIVFLAFAFTLYQIFNYNFVEFAENDSSNIAMDKIGRQMLSITDTGYALPFEVVSILLLAALIGCIVIAQRLANKE